MKRLVVLAAAAALAACGGSNGTPSTSIRSFTYGTPTAASSSQLNAASEASTGIKMMSTAAISAQIQNASAAPQFADDLAVEVLPSAAVAGVPQSLWSKLPGWDGAKLSANGLLASRSSALASSNCVVQTATSLTYNNCSESSDGYTGTVNGSIAVNAGVIKWELTFTIKGSSNGSSVDGSFYWVGQFTVTSTTFVGNGRTAADLKFSGNGGSGEIKYVAGVDANLTFNDTCITGGTLEVRRQYTVSGSGSNGSGAGSGDAAVKFTWAAGSACPSTPTVQTGT